LEERARKLILAHEREHARSYDPILLALGVFLVVVAPWNVVNWLILRRLRLAIEMDCDQRVLRAHPDTRSYGALLLDVAERTLPSVMPQAALVEYGTSLETRIRAMISSGGRYRAWRVSGNLLAMGALVAVACVTPRPYASLPPAERVARLRSDLADAERSLPNRRAADASTMTADQHDVYLRTQYLKEHDASNSVEIRRLQRQLDSMRAISAMSESRAADKPVPSLSLGNYQVKGRLKIQNPDPTERLNVGAKIPRTRREIIPTHEQMVATLHKAHPEIFDDKSSNPLIGTLLFDIEGELLATAAVRSTEPRKWPDGQDNREFERNIFRRAFGDLMNIGPIIQNGTISYFDESTPHDGAPRVMYAVLLRLAEKNFGGGMSVKSGNQSMNITSVMSYRAPQGAMDQKEVDERLILVVSNRIGQAFGRWSRSDSAVYLAFDHDDQLFSAAAGPIAQNGELEYVTGLLKSRMPLPPSHDFEVVGFSTVFRNTSGNKLDKPLQIVWGRVKQGTQLSNRSPRFTSERTTPPGLASGSSSRSSEPGAVNRDMHNRVLGIVKSRASQALGNWERANTALALYLDADDQYLGHGVGPIAQNARLLYLLDYFGNLNSHLVNIDDIETVGVDNYTSEGGRQLDQPLQVVWARLKRGAKLKN
ncbi:MAG: M56 family metallopeptidase, partial [Gemmatimonadaceae bacterium]